ncbi:hypothetical protein LCGC14_0365120 [marine sediment metagenome]|uniref:HTH cro/C1-type domain-containing protein n=1 Tax=marine sediment metagenome TaxID=412755 RepID=A0A0F9T716_9ZZZZ
MTPKAFKKIRLKMKLSQTEFANKLFYSRTATISDKERGKTSITRRDLRMIEELLTNS